MPRHRNGSAYVQIFQGESKVKCTECGIHLTQDDIGLTKKLLGKTLTEYCCVHCISKRLNVSEQRLREKIEEFRKSGCTLFSQKQC